jgi:putative ABC transport system permease protein
MGRSPTIGSTLIVSGSELNGQLARALKETVQRAEQLVVTRIRPLNQELRAIRFPRQFMAALLGTAGLIALVLAGIGLYGLVSHAVTARTGEIGVRAALGAQGPNLIRLVMTDGMKVTLIGSAIGLVLALSAARATSAFLIPIPGIDPIGIVCVPVLLLGVTGAACYLPGRRAARVDPMVAIREL